MGASLTGLPQRMLSDFTLAFRHLRKQPGFTTVAVLTLALCVGANTAIFSIVHAVLLRPLPYPAAERLVYVNNSYPRSNLLKAGASIPDYFDRLDRAPSVEAAALFTWDSFNLAGAERPVRVLGLRATPSLFDTLHATPLLGRGFTEDEARPGNDQVVVLGHALWQEHFGGRASVVGEAIRLHGQSYTVIGVMPPGFLFPQPEVKLWVPYGFSPEQRSDSERGHEFSDMLVRLKPGASAAQLEAECTAIIQANAATRPDARAWVERSGFCARVTPVLEETVGEVRAMLWLVQAGVVAALLIGCVNVGNLLLARATVRRRELAVRTALGANAWRLLRQLATECLLLFGLGGILGWWLAHAALSVTEAFGIASLPRGETVVLDRQVLLFTLLSVGTVALTFGLLPLASVIRVPALEALRAAGGRTSASQSQLRLRHALVVAEVALAVMLLTTAGLFSHSFARLQRQSPGFDRSGVLTARLTLPPIRYPEDAQRLAFADRAVADLQALPGVAAVGFTDVIPFGYHNSQGTYFVEGYTAADREPPPHGLMRSISPDYFAAMRIPLLQGRAFNAADHANAAAVVIIDQVLADRYFPGRSPLGQRIYRNSGEPRDYRTIVGVVAAVKHQGLDDPTRKETLYFPYAQRPVESFTLVVRTAPGSPPESLIGPTRRVIQRLDPEQPLYEVSTLENRVAETLQRQRVPMRLLGIFGGMALLLAALGVYGVLAFNVAQRTQEFGIRAALGATAGEVMALVVRNGLRLVLLGVGLGLAGYLGVSRALRSLIFEITPLDPLALVAASTVLVMTALLACWIPARRAARVAPLVALRGE